MNEFEKDEILKQVGSILQFCQNIVSRLSSSPPVPEVNNNNANNKELIETITEFRDEEQEYHGDCEENDLWWDDHYPPSHFYTLVYDDDDVSLFSLDVSYAEFLLPSDMLEEARNPLEENMMMTKDKLRDVMKSENALMQSVIQFLQVATPSAIYDPNWREENFKKWIAPQLLSIWTNAETIFDNDEHGDDDDMNYVLPVIEYPSIDLRSVNSRFIDNIPKPSLFPIHGVSPDPDFYHKWYPSNEPYKSIQKFREPLPFGAEYGYDTNLGVVPPSTEPIHAMATSGSKKQDGNYMLSSPEREIEHPQEAEGGLERSKRRVTPHSYTSNCLVYYSSANCIPNYVALH